MTRTSDTDLVLIALWALLDPVEAGEISIDIKSVHVGRSQLARACASVRELNQRHIEAAIHHLAGAGSIDIVKEPGKGRSGAAVYELLAPPPTEVTVISHQVGLGSVSMLQYRDAEYRVVRRDGGLAADVRVDDEWCEMARHHLLLDVIMGGPLGLLYRAAMLAFVSGRLP